MNEEQEKKYWGNLPLIISLSIPLLLIAVVLFGNICEK